MSLASKLALTRGWLDEVLVEKSFHWHPFFSQNLRQMIEGQGKAVRPYLLIWTYHSTLGQEFEKPSSEIMEWALALEMIHTYSLIHDDLPCMDDDDFRRGRPTLHRLHGEAAALLAGDAFLTGAFEILSQSKLQPQNILAISELSQAAGAGGMISGQFRDLYEKPLSTKALMQIHQEKTGALFGAAVTMGALAAGKNALDSYREWGLNLGVLFQIADDFLDKENLDKIKTQDISHFKEKVLSGAKKLFPQNSVDDLVKFILERSS